jgi:hypothetical protein
MVSTSMPDNLLEMADGFNKKILDTLGNNWLAKEKNTHDVGSSLTTTHYTLYAPH